MWPMIEGMLSYRTSTWPPIRSVIAGPAPLYGMCFMSMPVMYLNSSPDRCTEVPEPDDAMLILPGGFFAYSMNSWMVLAGKFLGTVITFGTRVMPPTGTMSLRKTNDRFLYSVALIALAGF